MTVTFTRLILIELVFDAFSCPLQSLSQASGKMKLYQSVVGGILLLNLPFAYLVLQHGADAYAVQYVAIFIGALAFLLRVFINSYLTGLKVKNYFLKCVIPCVVTLAFACILPVFVHFLMKKSVLKNFF